MYLTIIESFMQTSLLDLCLQIGSDTYPHFKDHTNIVSFKANFQTEQ